MNSGRREAVVIGVSAGGLDALESLLSSIPDDFALSVVVVQHLHPHQDKFYIEFLEKSCPIPVREADEKEPVAPGVVYFAPPNYHLMIEADKTFSLSIDEKVNFSRPSVDVLFETAAQAYGPALIGIVLTGANRDGAEGLRRIKESGGLTIVQDPAGAEFPAMPLAALEETEPDYVLDLEQIGRLLGKISRGFSAAELR